MGQSATSLKSNISKLANLKKGALKLDSISPFADENEELNNIENDNRSFGAADMGPLEESGVPQPKQQSTPVFQQKQQYTVENIKGKQNGNNDNSASVSPSLTQNSY